jgi:predicted glycogen debranching enzyme
MEETIKTDNDEFRLSTNAYPGTLYPTGYEHLEEFRLDPFPVFRFRVAGVALEKEICLVRGENTVIVQYRLLESAAPIRLEFDLLVNYRTHHSLTHDISLDFSTDSIGKQVKIGTGDDSTLFYAFSDKANFLPTGYWYRNFQYEQDHERGYDFQENAYNPGRFLTQLDEGDSVNVGASIQEPPNEELGRIVSQQRREPQALVRGIDDNFLADLLTATNAFIVKRGEGVSCVAGYHWFADWGRDAMIALPGLALVTHRFRAAELLLKTFAKHMKCGLVPNYFSEFNDSPHYNSLDATMWFFHACRKYYQYTNDVSTIKALYPALKSSIDSLLRGTVFRIKADSNLLLNIGVEDIPLTWMDAKVGDFCVTPRDGRPVEVNALWHCALDTMSGFAKLVENQGDRSKFSTLAHQVKSSFRRVFWNAAGNCLYDRIGPEGADASIRPNQIIAAALPGKILGRTQEKAIVETVQRELLTPYGLRTLSPSDQNYKGRYEGDQVSRDLAYHQGSAWPWLLGPFIKAYVRVYVDTAHARLEALRFLQPIRLHMSEAGLGYISELFDGDAPQRPRGCIAQAWSVAEVLRAYYEDILGKEPKDPLA